METTNRRHSVTTVVKTGDAVGVQGRKWVIAIVNNNTEKKCSERLMKMGYESYVPTQRETHRWCTGKTKTIDRIVLPSLVFIRVNEQERKEIVTLSFIHKFMTNRAGAVDGFNRHAIATIPDVQIETLKFMLYNSETPVTVEAIPLKLGDKIQVIRGKLSGLVGSVLYCSDVESYLCVKLDILGCAKVRISTSDIQKL
jgi:transcription antitermination factor NusG